MTPATVIAEWLHHGRCQECLGKAERMIEVLREAGFSVVPTKPTAKMLEASWVTCRERDPEHRMAVELAGREGGHKLKTAKRWAAMLAACAQGGEAQRAETPLSGSVADEHPVAEGDAP